MAASDQHAPSGAPDQPSAVALSPAPLGPGVGEITLAPLAPPREPAPARPSRAFGVVLTGVVLLFAFLVSSFAVRNSEFWLHLATGRLLARGEYRFGADYVTYTSDDEAYWVNHAWLFDLALYASFQASGGLGLVILKAMAVTALAWLMLRIRRPGTVAALPAACTLLALLAMSPYLLLQPACASLLLLGLSFLLLWRLHAGGADDQAPTFGAQLWRYGPVLLLFALWANLDEWFFLGPVLAALFWAGEMLGPPGRRRTPGLLAPAGLAACLLNPHFYRVFTSLPPELTPAVWASELHQDPRFRSWFLSPWQLGDYFDPSTGLSAAGIAYFALVALGLTSFALRAIQLGLASGLDAAIRSLVGWRLLVWGAFALLSAWQVRMIPFFAVVAGPITALNLQDLAATMETFAAQTRRRRMLVGWAHAALLASGFALAVLAWPGWLQAVPHEQHRVAWEVQPDPSLQRVAETLRQWREKGLLVEGEHMFPLHPEVAHYCAWFAPGEKGFLDERSPRFRQLAPQYEAVCKALASIRTDSESAGEWREILRAHDITVVVLDDPDEQRILPGLHRLAPATDEWDLLQIDGRTLVFGWKKGRPGGSFKRLNLNPHRLAFGPGDRDSALPPAPLVGPQRSPRRLEWWERFLTAAPTPGWQSDAAMMYLRYFDDRAPVEQRHALARHAAGVVGVAALGTPVAGEQVLLRLVEDIPGFGTREPDLPLLAVRAARFALATNPDDANAWHRLGQAYVRLHHATNERPSSGQSPLLGLLRHVQAITALEHAVRLNPDLEAAHDDLSILYGERKFLDAALDHRRHSLRLTRQRGPHRGENQKEFDNRLKAEKDAVVRLEQLVQDHKNEYALRSSTMSGDPLGRAILALSLGLPLVAVDDVLLQSSVQSFGGEGARLQLELLLQLGRPDVARGMLDDPDMRESKDKLEISRVPAPARPDYQPFYRLPAYDWLRFLQAAASGDYAQAAEALDDLVQPLADSSHAALRQLRPALPMVLAFELGLAAEPQLLLPRVVVLTEHSEMVRFLTEISFRSAQRAELLVLGGLLATERGSPTDALRSFDAALAAAAERTPQGDFAAAPLAAAYRRRLQAFAAEAEEK